MCKTGYILSPNLRTDETIENQTKNLPHRSVLNKAF